jgi:hypothetical protein
MNDKNIQINIAEGSITFWTKENQVDWSSSDVIILFEKSFNGNSILILKDADSKLKFFHVFLGKGRTDVALDVKELNQSERHFIAVTWSTTAKEIALYVDGGKLAKTQKINYGST